MSAFEQKKGLFSLSYGTNNSSIGGDKMAKKKKIQATVYIEEEVLEFVTEIAVASGKKVKLATGLRELIRVGMETLQGKSSTLEELTRSKELAQTQKLIEEKQKLLAESKEVGLLKEMKDALERSGFRIIKLNPYNK